MIIVETCLASVHRPIFMPMWHFHTEISVCVFTYIKLICSAVLVSTTTTTTTATTVSSTTTAATTISSTTTSTERVSR